MIPNLNEMMEEYVEASWEEVTPELQTVAIQEKRAETRTKTKQQQEESRKRKRDAKESEIEQGEDVEVDDFVSDRAHVIMEQTLLQNDFIGERGFKKLISPFREVMEKRWWNLLCEYKPAGFATFVREFSENMVGKKEKTCYIRGK